MNLTIILTLTCLSVVALGGLLLLPISDGIAQLWERDWEYNDDRTSASYYAHHDQTNRSWTLSSSIDAKVVNASVGVSAFDAGDFTTNTTLRGNGRVSVYKAGYNFRHDYWDWNNDCNNHDGWGRCQGHEVPPEADSNEPGHEGYKEGRHDNLRVRVQASKISDKKVWATSKKTGIRTDVSLGLEHEGIGSANIEFSVGKEWYTSTEKSRTVTYYSNVQTEAIAHYVGVPPNLKLRSTALTYFDFDGLVFEFNSVIYEPPPDEDE